MNYKQIMSDLMDAYLAGQSNEFHAILLSLPDKERKIFEKHFEILRKAHYFHQGA